MLIEGRNGAAVFLLSPTALLGAAGPGVRAGPAAAPLLVLAPGLCCVKLGRAGLALSCARLTGSLQETGTGCRHSPFPHPTPLYLHGVVAQRGERALCSPVLILSARPCRKRLTAALCTQCCASCRCGPGDNCGCHLPRGHIVTAAPPEVPQQ